MKNLIRFLLTVAMWSLIFMPVTAFSDPVGPLGAPVVTGSWTQAWTMIGSFDEFEKFIVSGGPFEAPGVDNFTV